jgi:hypothetical protein
MGTAIIAVIGTLAGAVVSGLVQHLTTTRERRRQELVTASIALVDALVGHRRHQYLKIKARRENREDTPDAVEARYAARSAVTTAMAALRLATRDRRLLTLAEEARGATFALGDASEEELPAARQRSLDAHDALLDAAAKAVGA